MTVNPLPELDFTTGSDLDLSEGFALFPAAGSARALKQYAPNFRELGRYQDQVDAFSVDFGAVINEVYGIAGPAYVVDVATTDENSYETGDSGTIVSLALDHTTFAGGIEVGASDYFYVECILIGPGNVPYVENPGTNVTVDLVSLLVQLIETVLDEGSEDAGPLTKLDNLTNNGVLSSWGIYDQTTGISLDEDGIATDLEPSFTLPINIVPLCEGIPVLDVLSTIDAGFNEVGGGFSLGPALQFGLPTHITVPTVLLDGEPLRFNGITEGAATIVEYRSATLTDPGTITSVGMTFEHTVSFSFGVGFFVTAQVAKVFNYGYTSPTLDLLELFHITAPTFGPYDNTLTDQVSEDRATRTR